MSNELNDLQLVLAQKKANELAGINQRLREELRKSEEAVADLKSKVATLLKQVLK